MKDNTKKEDGRVRYTKMQIRSAFYELTKQMPVEKITVTAICQKAEINRATFYKHYLDVPDLAEKLQTEAIEKFQQELENAEQKDIKGFIINVLDFIEKDSGRKLLFDNIRFNSNSLSSKMSFMIYEKFSQNIERYVSSDKNISKDALFAYISAGSAGLLDYWIKSGFKEPKEKIAAELIELSSATIKKCE